MKKLRLSDAWTFPGMLLLLTAFFLLVKYYLPALLHTMFESGNVAVIQQMAGITADLSFSGYWGYIHERFLGPAEQVLSVMILGCLCWKYDNLVLRWRFWAVLFVFLVVTKWEVLFWPTYGEANAGHFVEALWLKNHHFDYGLLAQQKHFGEGGPKVYLISIFPTVLAFLMDLITHVKARFIVLHLFVFAQSAAIIALLRMIFQKFMPGKTALLSALIVLMLPLFQAQTEFINMEIPVTLAAVASLYFLLQSRMAVAGACALSASLLKGPGGIICAGFFVYMVLIYFFDDRHRGKWQYPLFGLLVFVLAFLKRYLRFFLYPVQPKNSTIDFLVGWRTVWDCRYLMLGLALVCIGVAAIFIREKFIQKKSFSVLMGQHRALILMGIFTVMWYAFYINVSVMGPRYKMLVIPFLIGSITYMMQYILVLKRMVYPALWAVLIAAAVGSYGFFFPNKIESAGYSYNALERSLEYRNDHFMVMDLAQRLEQDYADWTIVAPFPLAQMLAFPEFGFVKKDLDIVSYGMQTFYDGLRNYPGSKYLNLRQTVFIGMKSTIDVPFSYPMGPADAEIGKIRVGNKQANLFMGGSSIERVYQGLKQWKSLRKG